MTTSDSHDSHSSLMHIDFYFIVKYSGYFLVYVYRDFVQ